MQKVLEGQTFADADSFVAAINKARLAVGKAWFTFVGTVNGKSVAMKSYGHTYLQILKVDGLDNAPPMDTNVGDWKAAIRKAVA